MKLLSENLRFYRGLEDKTLNEIMAAIAPGKVLASESGWLFLINDTNNFLNVQYGKLAWDSRERTAASNIIEARSNNFFDRGIFYRKFIVPEKSVVYPEFLPSVLPEIPNVIRPAQFLAADSHGVVEYLGDYLRDGRSIGNLYFRGDTHTNWLGAWLVYWGILECLNATLPFNFTAIPLSHLRPSIAGWEGDLWTQMSTAQRAEFDTKWSFALPSYGCETATSLLLADDYRLAWKTTVPSEYISWFQSRETFVFERRDGIGPRAVVFRDSTFDFCLDLFAQHFSRVVFVWYQGQVVLDVIEKERPDIVVHVMAERFVSSYPRYASMVKIS